LARFGPELARALVEFPLPVCWVIADDGSGEDEHVSLLKLRDSLAEIFPDVDLHFADQHRGKGAVVREAWSLAPAATWLAFVDADGSVNAEDMLGLIDAAVSGGLSVMGIRKQTATTRVRESHWRGLFHRAFLTAVRVILNVRSDDPQCGSKVIHGDSYRRVAEKLREDGLAFDSELLASLRKDGTGWIEVPVNWEEKPGGTVKPLRDGWAMLAALFRIRSRIG
jgi:hypothetical protein